MKMPNFADIKNLEIKKDPAPPEIPDDISLMELADRVVRGKLKLGAQQMRLLIELLPYHAPKLMAVANVTEGSFAKMLDRAIEVRDMAAMKLIEAKPEPVESEANDDVSLRHELPREVAARPFNSLKRY